MRLGVLDVGSNTCWAANQFARRGLNVVALDIATAEMQGLYTAEFRHVLRLQDLAAAMPTTGQEHAQENKIIRSCRKQSAASGKALWTGRDLDFHALEGLQCMVERRAMDARRRVHVGQFELPNNQCRTRHRVA